MDIRSHIPAQKSRRRSRGEKEYQKRGIARHLASLKRRFLHERGIKYRWYRTDADNEAVLKWAESNKRKIWKRNNKQVFFLNKVEEEESNQE